MGGKFKGGPHILRRKHPSPGETNGTGNGRCRFAGTTDGGAYSCNCRFSDSTSSASAMYLATSASILRTECSTVVSWGPPRRRPSSRSQRSVHVVARHITHWRGRTPVAERPP